eukprot:360072-Chlamydomonas_euryale.AAC.2
MFFANAAPACCAPTPLFLPHTHLDDTPTPCCHAALQAVIGSLVKGRLAARLGCSGTGATSGTGGHEARRLYHATVMPCYDKKLEASRDELSLPGGEPEVRRARARVWQVG